MKKVLRFDAKRRRWTWDTSRGARSQRGSHPSHAEAKTWGHAFSAMRPFLLLIGLVTAGFVYAGHGSSGLLHFGFLQGTPEQVKGDFTRCGWGRGAFCVIDGDTFKLGDRKIRVLGIDTAEVKAQCSAEAAQAEQSTAALQRWLNRGPFQMTARLDEPVDRYGRDLRIVKRIGEDGTEDRLADFMQAEGGARSYLGGYRGDWC